MLRIAPHTGNVTSFGFNQNTAADTAIATGRFNFSFHSLPSASYTATPMPQRKNNDLE
jgi:hypothetical protein